ncbi:abscisate beta-glucosyltransferase-like [Trifolium medium]|uniref:Abscisate beta-glucosyltransferase-like n=1 Tax=Trifolium medium TaxID=97028 RepID=A0A392LZ15_9FABA|nr:abscisate beta-glucosyltransferase-like [Trifolium medium]
MDVQSCLNWLNSKKPNSVLYISFGSIARLHMKQIKEIAYGLEASDQSFIWVVGKIINSSKQETCSENWVLDGFEQRMKEIDKGLILRGWVPQLLILEHDAVGGFLTHCGWNSTLEEEMRCRVRHIAENARRAVEESGSSYADIEALIQELKILKIGKG